MISVTSLSSYMYCARKLFIEQVLGIRSKLPKDAMIKGSIRHSVYEKINLSNEAIIKSIDKKDFEFVFELYKARLMRILKQTIVANKGGLASIKLPLTDFFRQIKPLIENEAEHRAGKIFEFMEKTGFLGQELWENLMPKIKPEYRVSSEKLGFRGIIDELEIHTDFFVPNELKTGKTPEEGVWPGHKIQVGAYAMLLEEKFDVPVKKAVVRYLDSNTSREVSINPFLKQEILEIAEKVNLMLKSAEIPDFADSENKCKSCDLKDVCFDENLIAGKTKDLNRT